MHQSVLLLDLDGTLCDPREGFENCIGYALEKMALPLNGWEHFHTHIGPPLETTLGVILGRENAHRVPEAAAFYRERYRIKGIEENLVYPGIPEVLASLSRQYTLLLATSKPLIFAERILEQLGLVSWFSGVYGAGPDGKDSAKALVIRNALRQENLAAEACVMIGDRRHDVDGATANDMAACAVSWGYGSREELSAAKPRAIFETPGEMASFFLQGNLSQQKVRTA